MAFNIIRGENELTGNLIEISCGKIKILVEAGISLESDGTLSETERFVLCKNYDAVIISHGHLDHIGLISGISKDIPVYMGVKTLELYKLRNPSDDYSNYRTFRDGEIFSICDIKVTPYLCDHSAPDSYMLYFETPEEKILYTGDFRAKGRKNYMHLLNRLPEGIDVLISEFTNACSPQTYSEISAEEKMRCIMRSSDKPVFVLCSSSNIDRITGIYKAAVSSGRELMIDEDQENVLEIFGVNVPNAKSFNKVKIYGRTRLKNKAVSLKSLTERDNYAMIIKTSSLPYIKKLVSEGKNLSGSYLIYSMWSGYKDKESMKNFLQEISKLGLKTITVHASGHADKNAIEKLIERVRPLIIKTVHTRSKNDIFNE